MAKKTKTKAKWIDPTLVGNHHKVAICTSEADFKFELKRLRVPITEWPVWLANDAAANTFTFQGKKIEEKIMIVCIQKGLKKPLPILIHEAVHIFQQEMRYIQEDTPSDEFMAYSIEAIAERLIEAYK
jgi:hypothetical protein